MLLWCNFNGYYYNFVTLRNLSYEVSLIVLQSLAHWLLHVHEILSCPREAFHSQRKVVGSDRAVKDGAFLMDCF